MILGTQRGGTTSLRRWLREHPVATQEAGEVHFFDHNYGLGRRWYHAQFPTFLHRGRRIESSPYLLFHPLAPVRAAAMLPAHTRFVVLLREPADRAMSHYRLERSLGRESKSFAAALAAEDERLEGETEKVLRGERSRSHQWFSYRARGRYAEQVARWQEAVGPTDQSCRERAPLHRPVGRDRPARVVGSSGCGRALPRHQCLPRSPARGHRRPGGPEEPIRAGQRSSVRAAGVSLLGPLSRPGGFGPAASQGLSSH